jgi:hypothetical protein
MRLVTALAEDPLSTPEPYQVFQYIGLEYFEMQQCAMANNIVFLSNNRMDRVSFRFNV